MDANTPAVRAVLDLRPFVRYSLSISAVVLAFFIRLSLDAVWGAYQLPFITFFPAVVLAAWLGGFWPGALATVLSTIVVFLFWIEPRGLTLANPVDAVALGVFGVTGMLISVLNGAWRQSAAAVFRSESRLRTTITSIGDSVITTDAHGNITRMNALAEELTGWREADAIAQPVDDVFKIVNEATRAAAFSPVREALERGTIAQLANHTLLIARDGREVPIEDSAAPIRDRDGAIAGVILVFRDISRRRQTEKDRAALLTRAQESREQAEATARQLEIALQAGRMGTWQWRIDSNELHWSPGLEFIHGYEPGSFPGTFDAFRNEIHPEDRERTLQAIAETVKTEGDLHIEYRIVRRDASVRWVEGRGRVERDSAGQPLAMSGVCMDVTERKDAERRFRHAVESAPAAMVMVNREGRIILVNQMAERLLGYARHELDVLHIEQFIPVKLRDAHLEHRMRFFDTPTQRPMGVGRDLHALRKDGSEIPVEIGLSPVETGEGTMVIATITDITERKRIEAAREQVTAQYELARQEAEQASRLKDRFLATLSHELRTPLQSILAYAHSLTSSAVTPEQASRALEAIQRNVRAQTRLIDGLLDLSRIEAGKLDLDLAQVNVGAVLSGALEVIRPTAETKGISLNLTVPDESLIAYADAARLQQVFWNIISNAIKFTPQGGRVDIAAKRCDSQIQIRVSDTGDGISAEFLPHVFERFSQEQTETGKSRGGLGLGLAIVQELVEAHGGTVTAESAGRDFGSTFDIRLPAGTAEAAKPH